MKKKIAKIIGISAISIIIGSCGLSDKNTPEACKFEVSQALDKGNYDVVINKLKSDPTCGGAYTQEEGKIQLAAAYIGKAGFDIPSLINDVIDSSSKNQGTYQAFAQSIAKRVNSLSLNALEQAKKEYEDLVNNYGGCNSPNLPPIIKDACFYKNLVGTATAASALTLALGGGKGDIVSAVNSWVNPSACDDLNNNNVGDTADVTASAIEYAVNQTCSINGVNCNSLNKNLTFTDKTGKNYTFELVKIQVNDTNNTHTSCSVNPYVEYRLIDNTNNTVAVTDKFCKTDFTPCNSVNIANKCYPCPVISQSQGALNLNNTLVNVINNVNPNEIATVVGGNNKQTVQDINKLKQDICGGSTCTLTDIQNYLKTVK